MEIYICAKKEKNCRFLNKFTNECDYIYTCKFKKNKKMIYKVTSLYVGKYAKTKYGLTKSLLLAIWWFLSWSIMEFVRMLRLNNYHYDNIFGIGKKRQII
jgi:hypothetical protein